MKAIQGMASQAVFAAPATGASSETAAQPSPRTSNMSTLNAPARSGVSLGEISSTIAAEPRVSRSASMSG